MTLRPGGSYPAQRREQVRIRHRRLWPRARTTQARSNNDSGGSAGMFVGNFNPASPYTLYGSYVTPSGTPQKAAKAITPLKAS
jgi:hypothetical protein